MQNRNKNPETVKRRIGAFILILFVFPINATELKEEQEHLGEEKTQAKENIIITDFGLEKESSKDKESNPIVLKENQTDTNADNNGDTLKRESRQSNSFEENYDGQPLSNSGAQISRQLMLHNEEEMSAYRPQLPLYKQSYPGLYVHGNLKEFAFEPTMTVTHGNSHHGKEGHRFLFHGGKIDTGHIFRGLHHSIQLDDLI